MSARKLVAARPAVEASEYSYTESIADYSLIYNLELSYPNDPQQNQGTVESVMAARPRLPGDTLHVLIDGLPDSPHPVVCWQLIESPPATWYGVRVGEDEFRVSIIPTQIYRHRDGIDTVPEKVGYLWHRWNDNSGFEHMVPCPAASGVNR